MKSIIERYQEARDLEHCRLLNPVSEAKIWQREVTTLRQQVQNLQHNNRQLLGEELSSLNIRDLQFLQSQVEMSLHSVRKRKEHLLAEEIQELNHKGFLVHKENIELQKKFSIAYQHNIELQRKLSGVMTSSEQATGSSKAPGESTTRCSGAREPIDLELCQEEHADE
uniref:MADS25 n=1 Tax=Bambusa multiplex TaxID=4582 RepID=A0A3Q8BC94_BAMML|nr:MADS25 [Bambusa multiplex]